jgi:hypothetical protein
MNLTVSNKTNTLQALFYKGYRALAHGTPIVGTLHLLEITCRTQSPVLSLCN